MNEWARPMVFTLLGVCFSLTSCGKQLYYNLPKNSMLTETKRSFMMTKKPCQDPVGNSGICLFKWDCISQNGISLATCIDGFLFGACCKLEPKSAGEYSTDIDRTLPFESQTTSFNSGSNPPHSTLYEEGSLDDDSQYAERRPTVSGNPWADMEENNSQEQLLDLPTTLSAPGSMQTDQKLSITNYNSFSLSPDPYSKSSTEVTQDSSSSRRAGGDDITTPTVHDSVPHSTKQSTLSSVSLLNSLTELYSEHQSNEYFTLTRTGVGVHTEPVAITVKSADDRLGSSTVIPDRKEPDSSSVTALNFSNSVPHATSITDSGQSLTEIFGVNNWYGAMSKRPNGSTSDHNLPGMPALGNKLVDAHSRLGTAPNRLHHTVEDYSSSQNGNSQVDSLGTIASFLQDTAAKEVSGMTANILSDAELVESVYSSTDSTDPLFTEYKTNQTVYESTAMDQTSEQLASIQTASEPPFHAPLRQKNVSKLSSSQAHRDFTMAVTTLDSFSSHLDNFEKVVNKSNILNDSSVLDKGGTNATKSVDLIPLQGGLNVSITSNIYYVNDLVDTVDYFTDLSVQTSKKPQAFAEDTHEYTLSSGKTSDRPFTREVYSNGSASENSASDDFSWTSEPDGSKFSENSTVTVMFSNSHGTNEFAGVSPSTEAIPSDFHSASDGDKDNRVVSGTQNISSLSQQEPTNRTALNDIESVLQGSTTGDRIDYLSVLKFPNNPSSPFLTAYAQNSSKPLYPASHNQSFHFPVENMSLVHNNEPSSNFHENSKVTVTGAGTSGNEFSQHSKSPTTVIPDTLLTHDPGPLPGTFEVIINNHLDAHGDMQNKFEESSHNQIGDVYTFNEQSFSITPHITTEDSYSEVPDLKLTSDTSGAMQPEPEMTSSVPLVSTRTPVEPITTAEKISTEHNSFLHTHSSSVNNTDYFTPNNDTPVSISGLETTETKELSTRLRPEPEEDVASSPTTNSFPGQEQSTTTELPTSTEVLDYKKDCGVRMIRPFGRIVGGKNTYFGKWPWQALVKEATWLGLFVKNKCGGVLINAKYVITAAHCQPGFLATLVVVLGAHDLTGVMDSKGPITRNVKRMVVHRHYNPQTFENDLALLEMESPVEFLPYVVPICLPHRKEDFTGKMAFVTGWGKLVHGGDVPNILQEVQVPIVTNSECQRMFQRAGHQKVIRSNFICAGYKTGGQDSCEGDSGGPLMVQRDDRRWVLVGTVSHGIGCADPNLPGVYMRMSAYRPWIDSIINK